MLNFTFESIDGEDIEQCRELCNELMAYQKSMAFIAPEKFDDMNFDTRMKKSYDSALRKQLIVVKDHGVPVGYVFSTIDEVTRKERDYVPAWAPVEDASHCVGFYPKWVELPQKIGCLNNLYLRDAYRSSGLGARLYQNSIEWLESFPDTNLTFVYISNGNNRAMKFYLSHGFLASHSVFGGFIMAAYKKKDSWKQMEQ